MALIQCPECDRQVSTEAATCPSCGYPIAERRAQAHENAVLAEVRPSWWRYFWHLFFFWLIVPPIIAYFGRRTTVLRVQPGRVFIERGLLSKSYREFAVRDLRSIDIDQGLLARMVGIGDLTISTSATVDAAERLEGIPDPHGVRNLILAQK